MRKKELQRKIVQLKSERNYSESRIERQNRTVDTLVNQIRNMMEDQRFRHRTIRWCGESSDVMIIDEYQISNLPTFTNYYSTEMPHIVSRSINNRCVICHRPFNRGDLVEVHVAGGFCYRCSDTLTPQQIREEENRIGADTWVRYQGALAREANRFWPYRDAPTLRGIREEFRYEPCRICGNRMDHPNNFPEDYPDELKMCCACTEMANLMACGEEPSRSTLTSARRYEKLSTTIKKVVGQE